eukprot:9396916-Pyramimonas_sp.AAC.1
MIRAMLADIVKAEGRVRSRDEHTRTWPKWLKPFFPEAADDAEGDDEEGEDGPARKKPAMAGR